MKLFKKNKNEAETRYIINEETNEKKKNKNQNK